MLDKLDNGTYIVANLQGFESVPWKNDPSKFNNRLVLYREYKDRYGASSRNYINIDIQGPDIQRVQAQCGRLTGKRVMIPTVHDVKSGTSRDGKPYAFQSIYLPKGAEIMELPSTVKQVAGQN